LKIILFKLAVVLIACSAFANNTNRIDSLKNELKKNPSADAKIHIFIDLAALYSQIDPEQAKMYSQKGYDLAIKTGDFENAANAINNLAVTFYYQGNLKEALTQYERALEIDKKSNIKENIATRLSNIGMIYCDMGEYEKAIEYHKQALDIDIGLKREKEIAVRYNNIGMVYAFWSQYKEALAYFKKALKIAEKLGEKEEIAIRLNNIGMIFIYMKKYDQAVEYFERALKLDKALKIDKNIAIRLNNLGKAYLGLEQFEKALDFFNESLELSRKMNNLSDIAISLKNIGTAQLNMKEYQQAVKNLESSLEINSEIGIQSEIAGIYQLLGDVWFKKENIMVSIDYYRKSIKICEALNLKNNLMENYGNLSKAFEKVGRTDSAYHYFKLFSVLEDSIFSDENNRQLNFLQSQYEMEKKEKEIALKEKKIANLNEKNAEDESEMLKQRYAFSFIIILIIAAFIVVYFQVRSREIKTKNKLKAELNLYMQKALRQQMNPHFIFNTLTSIQYYILQNDNISSNKYLSKFAKLMRLTLDNSQHNTIRLEDELNALNLYIELEQLRFETKFEYEIITDDSLLEYQVPTLIIQPFVENSIRHGIMHLQGKGRITVEILNADGLLLCIIEDNGVGRKRSEEIKNSKNKTHQSLGTKITQTRLDLINSLYGSGLNARYTDLYDDAGTATGTRVEIVLNNIN